VNRHLVLPILVPFLTVVLLALLNGYPRLERAVNLLSCTGLTVFVFWLLGEVDRGGIQATVIGGWFAPWGIAFVADRLACIMLCLSMSVGTLALVYACFTAEPRQERYFFHPLSQVLLLGVNWSFITGDLFNLFVAYEVMLIGSYGMMMVGASKQQVRQTFKYIAINSIGSTLFVVACGLVYATLGTLNMADIALRSAQLEGDRAALVTAVSMLLMVVFALKAAAFPLFFWLPDSYPIVPAGLNGYFAGLLTKVGVYSLLRMFVLCFRQPGAELVLDVLLVLSGFTMLFGVLGALCQWEVRKILSWHIISQVGYMVMGIGLAASGAGIASAAVAATIFYVVHHIVVKSSLFLIGGIAGRVSGTQNLKEMGGVLDLAPGVAALFLVAAFSLAGMPPFSGFFAKLVLIRVGLADGQFAIVLVSLVTSLLTLYSMSKIWSYAFWRGSERTGPLGRYRAMMAPTAVLVAFTVVMGVVAEPFLRLANDAAQDIVDPSAYQAAVLVPVPAPTAALSVGAEGGR
jgi:multicomponent Na+:H+ antiporter subunit D